MKKIWMMLAGLFLATAALASGVYNITSRVSLTGPASLGVLQPNTPYVAAYGVAAPTPLASVGVSGDPQFKATANACAGSSSCVLSVQFNAPVGGDYSATVSGYSSHVGRYTASHTSQAVTAHVVGANYTLLPEADTVYGTGTDGLIPAVFTLTATGETPLLVSAIVVGDYLDTTGVANSGRVTLHSDCPPLLGVGMACQLTVSYNPTGLESDSGYYQAELVVQVRGNTRLQPAVAIGVEVTL